MTRRKPATKPWHAGLAWLPSDVAPVYKWVAAVRKPASNVSSQPWD